MMTNKLWSVLVHWHSAQTIIIIIWGFIILYNGRLREARVSNKRYQKFKKSTSERTIPNTVTHFCEVSLPLNGEKRSLLERYDSACALLTRHRNEKELHTSLEIGIHWKHTPLTFWVEQTTFIQLIETKKWRNKEIEKVIKPSFLMSFYSHLLYNRIKHKITLWQLTCFWWKSLCQSSRTDLAHEMPFLFLSVF